MDWSVWIIVGLVVSALELFVPSGFFLCIAGVAAVTTGLLVLVGLGGPDWFQWVLCGLIAVALVVFVRKRLLPLPLSVGEQSSSGTVGQELLATTEILPGGIGRGEFRGALWSVRNRGEVIIRAGERCVVESIDGVTLGVKLVPSRHN